MHVVILVFSIHSKLISYCDYCSSNLSIPHSLYNSAIISGSHMASIEVPLDTVSSSSGVYSGAGSEGSNSPDSHHVARLLVNQVIIGF